jgi:uncharacterized protein with NRDE domain
MAKLNGPCFSLGASKSIGKALTFTNWKGVNKATVHKTPKNPQTDEQQLNRSFFQEAIIIWQSLTAEEKQSFNESAANNHLQMSGYNLFIAWYMEL